MQGVEPLTLQQMQTIERDGLVCQLRDAALGSVSFIVIGVALIAGMIALIKTASLTPYGLHLIEIVSAAIALLCVLKAISFFTRFRLDGENICRISMLGTTCLAYSQIQNIVLSTSSSKDTIWENCKISAGLKSMKLTSAHTNYSEMRSFVIQKAENAHVTDARLSYRA